MVALAAMLATSTLSHADLVWPAVSVEERLLSLWSIPAGLVAEFVVLRWWLRMSLVRALTANITMNVASMAFGVVLIQAAGIGWDPGAFTYRVLHIETFSAIRWGATFVIVVLLNTGIESALLRLAFKVAFTRRSLIGLCLANGVSVGLALSNLVINPLAL